MTPQAPDLRSRRLIDAAASVALVAMIVLAFVLSGAIHGDFSANADEPSHVVSSLMVRDYLLNAFPGGPFAFAQNYYLHYPKVAIGHWPPIFYGCEAVWMLVFGRSRLALLAFPAAVCALLVLSLYFWVKRECGAVAAFSAAALFATCSLVGNGADAVGPDSLLALFAFWSVAYLGRFLESRRRWHAVLAILLAVCAVGTHGRGMLLAMVFPIALILARKTFGRVERLVTVLSMFFLFAVVVVVVFLPPLIGQAGYLEARGIISHISEMGRIIPVSLGWPLVVLAAAGLPAVLRKGLRWSTMAALLIGGAIFHIVVGVWFENHFLLTFIPPLVLFAALGVASAWQMLRWPVLRAALVAILAFFAAYALYTTASKPDLGYHRLVSSPGLPGFGSKVYLIAGDPIDEGAFIAEVDLQTPGPPGHYILRSSRMLSRSTWNGYYYRLLFPTPDVVRDQLDHWHVGFIVLEESWFRPDITQLAAAVRAAPAVWSQVTVPAVPSGVSVFRRIGPAPAGPLRIDVETSGGQVFHIRE